MRLETDERRPSPNVAPSKEFTGPGSLTAESTALHAAEAEHTPRCRRCGHPLTAEASVNRLLGPVCLAHVLAEVAAGLRGAR